MAVGSHFTFLLEKLTLLRFRFKSLCDEIAIKNCFCQANCSLVIRFGGVSCFWEDRANLQQWKAAQLECEQGLEEQRLLDRRT